MSILKSARRAKEEAASGGMEAGRQEIRAELDALRQRVEAACSQAMDAYPESPEVRSAVESIRSAL